jgi:hypothetical protein
MDGPQGLRSEPLHSFSALEMFETSPTTFKPGDVEVLVDMHEKTAPEYVIRRAAYLDACEWDEQLVKTLPVLEAMTATAKQQECQLFIASADEIISNTTACDVQGLAARMRPVQDQVALVEEAKNLLTFKRIPAARLGRLEAALNLRKIEALQASILASLSHARTIEKLVTAGVFQNENRVALISEFTERLRASAKEAARQVDLAEEALREERKRQLATEQVRMATGAITKAEAASAIPVYAGHVA